MATCKGENQCAKKKTRSRRSNSDSCLLQKNKIKNTSREMFIKHCPNSFGPRKLKKTLKDKKECRVYWEQIMSEVALRSKHQVRNKKILLPHIYLYLVYWILLPCITPKLLGTTYVCVYPFKSLGFIFWVTLSHPILWQPHPWCCAGWLVV